MCIKLFHFKWKSKGVHVGFVYDNLVISRFIGFDMRAGRKREREKLGKRA